MSKTVNITIRLRDEEQSHHFEKYIRDMFGLNVIDYINLPDTEKLYENDKHFRKLVKNYKDAQRLKNEYINEKN